MKKSYALALICILTLCSCTVSSHVRSKSVEGFQGPLDTEEIRIGAEILPKFKYMFENILLRDLAQAFEDRGIKVSKTILNVSEVESTQKLNEKMIYNSPVSIVFRIRQTGAGKSRETVINLNDPLNPGIGREMRYTNFEMEILNKENGFVYWKATAYTTRDMMRTSDEDAISKLAQKIISKLQKDLIITPESR